MKLLLCILGIAVLVPTLSWGDSGPSSLRTGKEAEWSTFNLGKARAVLVEFEVSGLDVAEAVYEWENLILEAQRARTSDEIVERLREQQKLWRTMSERMKKEMDEVIEQARKDSMVRLVANILSMGALVANAAHNWKKKKLDEKEKAAKKRQIQMRLEGYLAKYEDGQWRVLEPKRLWIQGRVPTGLEDSSVAVMRAQLEEWSRLAPALLCNVKKRVCFAPDIEPSAQSETGAAELRSEKGDRFTVIAPTTFEPSSEKVIDLAKELDLELVELVPGYRVK